MGVVILHGAGSAKESHFDFARGCRADGMAALAYDARGHGRSEGDFGPWRFDDALAMAELLRAHAPRIALRGSSMGGFQAIHAAAQADGRSARSSRSARHPRTAWRGSSDPGQELHFRCDSEATGPWLESLDIYAAAASLGPETALLLMHARGDEQVPFEISERLHEAAKEPKRLLLMPGGHHRSIQHDEELQAISRRFIRDPPAVLRIILVKLRRCPRPPTWRTSPSCGRRCSS